MPDPTTIVPTLDIEALIPHAAPMILIDSVAAQGPSLTRSVVRIAEDSMFYEAPHGVPAYLGIEYIAQTVAAHAGLHARRQGEPVRVGFLLGTREYKCAVTWFRLGSRLTIDVTPVLEMTDISKFQGVIEDQLRGKLADCAVTVYLRSGSERTS